MELTRRAMLGALGGLAVGGTVASVVGTSIAADPKTKRFEQINGDFGWKPHKLDPKECAAVAYDGYWHKGLGCAYGAFYAIVGLMGEKYGAMGLFHGECVALGMLPMIESKALQKRVRAVYRRLGLPLRTTYNKEKVLAEMLHDKKAQGGQITIIKVPGLGCWRAETIPVEGLRPLLGMEE